MTTPTPWFLSRIKFTGIRSYKMFMVAFGYMSITLSQMRTYRTILKGFKEHVILVVFMNSVQINIVTICKK